ncbi:hypothetical protein OROGR_000746 [Orobanche gracilis]
MTGGCCIPIHGIGLMNDLRIWKYWSSTQENGFILSMVASLIAICHKKKRAKQVKKLIQRGLPRRDSQRILGF